MATLAQITDRHDLLVKRKPKIGDTDSLKKAYELLDEIMIFSETVYSPEERNILAGLARSVGELIFNISREYPPVKLKEYKEPTSVLPFLDREAEMASILSPSAHSYHIINAPPGFGKTSLLQELHRRFLYMDWKSILISVAKATPDAILLNLATALGMSLPQDDNSVQSNRLTAFLQKQWLDTPKAGLSLLFDVHYYEMDLVRFVMEDFIPDVVMSLKSLRFFTENPGQFRIIVATRALPHIITSLRDEPLFHVIDLLPFDYVIVRDAIARSLPMYSEKATTQIAAHLTHLSGGHPGSVAALLELYRDMLFIPDEIMEEWGNRAYLQILKSITDEILAYISPDFPKKLTPMLTKLGIYRFFDSNLLRYIIEKERIHDVMDEFDFADILTTSYLCSRRGRFLYNDSIRRLLAIDLLYKQPERFHDICIQAKEYSLHRLADDSVPARELWAIEFLFQALQLNTKDIQRKDKRRSLREEFYSDLVPHILHLYTERVPLNERKWEIGALMQQMEQDREFIFTVNYYLRDEQYNNEPYVKLSQQMTSFLHNQDGKSR